MKAGGFTFVEAAVAGDSDAGVGKKYVLSLTGSGGICTPDKVWSHLRMLVMLPEKRIINSKF